MVFIVLGLIVGINVGFAEAEDNSVKNTASSGVNGENNPTNAVNTTDSKLADSAPVVTNTTLTAPVMSIGGSSPATDSALQSSQNGSLTIEPIPVADFVNHVERKMFEIVMGIRQFSIPYAVFVLTIGGLVLMIPFHLPMQKRLGFGIIGFGLLGFVLIWFGPVLLGIARSLAQP